MVGVIISNRRLLIGLYFHINFDGVGIVVVVGYGICQVGCLHHFFIFLELGLFRFCKLRGERSIRELVCLLLKINVSILQ